MLVLRHHGLVDVTETPAHCLAALTDCWDSLGFGGGFRLVLAGLSAWCEDLDDDCDVGNYSRPASEVPEHATGAFEQRNSERPGDNVGVSENQAQPGVSKLGILVVRVLLFESTLRCFLF